MLLNYIKLSFRLLVRSPFFTFINIAGLSVGFAVFFILWQHSTYELKSDQFHKDSDRIYRAYCDFYFGEGNNWDHYIFSTIPPVLAKLVQEKNKEVEGLTRLIHQRNFEAIRWAGPQTDTAGWSGFSTDLILSYVDEREEKLSIKQTSAAFADPNFFEFFTIPLTLGQPDQVLNRADAIVLSESSARRFFGTQNPIGKTLILNDDNSFTVTGVFKDLGDNTHLVFDLLFSSLHITNAMEGVNPFQETAVSYFKLNPNADIKEVEKVMTNEARIHWDFQKSFPGSIGEYRLQPLKDSPFQIFENDSYSPKSKLKLQVFLLVGIVVLIMAWVNYLNLQLNAQASRMKELATRKTAGAKITDFINQFLVESVIVNVLAVLVAITLIQLLKSPLEIWFQLSVPDWSEFNNETLIILLATVVVGIVIAALHPAISMWRLNIRSMLSFGKVLSDGRVFTKITSVLQFIIAIVLIIWFGTVYSQVNFVLTSSWGLDSDRVFVVELPVNDTIIGRNTHVEELKNELLSTAGVEDLTVSRTVVGDLFRNRLAFWRKDQRHVKAVPKSDGGVDERFIPFYKLHILAGRNFIRDNPADRNTVILSREAAKSMGWKPEEAIGKAIGLEKYSWRGLSAEAEVIGVIEDHRYSPLYLQSSMSDVNRGTILTYRNYLFPKNLPLKMSIRSSGSADNVEAIREKFEKVFPGKLFHWYFLDNHVNAHYQEERIARNQILLFTSLAIGIACLGLLGAISNKVVSKTKEIGIRKILGARLHQIAQILLSPTLKQIGIAALIGTPLAYALTESYLQKFSERIMLQWWHFALPVLLLILIMVFSVASVVWKAAKRNPVESLKYE